MFGIIKQTLARVNVSHDVFFNENSLYDDGSVTHTADALEKAGYVYRSAASQNPGENQPGEHDEENAGKGVATWFRRWGSDLVPQHCLRRR